MSSYTSPTRDLDSSSDTPSSPGTPGSPTKCALDGKRARLIKYLIKPTSHRTWSRLTAYHQPLSPEDSISDPVWTSRAVPTYDDDLPSTQLPSRQSSGSSDLTSMSKFREWGHKQRLKLSQDITLWIEEFYRYHKYRQAKRQGHTYESAAAISSVEFDRDSMMECYREYKATNANSTTMSTHLMSPDELIDEINAISCSIPPFSPVHTLSLEALEDLRRDIFGAEYLSDTPGETCPLLEPESFDSESSVEQFLISPENTPLLLSGNNETSFPKTSHQELPHDLSPSQITDSTSSKSSGALRSTSHVSTNSTGSSSFSMVTVSIPTLRNTDFLTTLVDAISEGQPIDSVYHPSEVLAVVDTSSRPMSKEATSESLINILDPESFEPMEPTDGVIAASLSPSRDQTQLSETPTLSASTEHLSNSTIKFKEYAEVLLYDDKGRLKRGPSAYKKDSMRRLKLVHEAPYPLTKEQRAEHFKQHGSLRLYETVPTTLTRYHCDYHVDFPSIRLSNSCRLKIPSFSPLSRSDAMEPNAKWKRMLTAQNQQRQSIFKLKKSMIEILPTELSLSLLSHWQVNSMASLLESFLPDQLIRESFKGVSTMMLNSNTIKIIETCIENCYGCAAEILPFSRPRFNVELRLDLMQSGMPTNFEIPITRVSDVHSLHSFNRALRCLRQLHGIGDTNDDWVHNKKFKFRFDLFVTNTMDYNDIVRDVRQRFTDRPGPVIIHEESLDFRPNPNVGYLDENGTYLIGREDIPRHVPLDRRIARRIAQTTKKLLLDDFNVLESDLRTPTILTGFEREARQDIGEAIRQFIGSRIKSGVFELVAPAVAPPLAALVQLAEELQELTYEDHAPQFRLIDALYETFVLIDYSQWHVFDLRVIHVTTSADAAFIFGPDDDKVTMTRVSVGTAPVNHRQE